MRRLTTVLPSFGGLGKSASNAESTLLFFFIMLCLLINSRFSFSNACARDIRHAISGTRYQAHDTQAHTIRHTRYQAHAHARSQSASVKRYAASVKRYALRVKRCDASVKRYASCTCLFHAAKLRQEIRPLLHPGATCHKKYGKNILKTCTEIKEKAWISVQK